MRPSRLLVVGVACAALLLSGCGGGTKTGGDVDLNATNKGPNSLFTTPPPGKKPTGPKVGDPTTAPPTKAPVARPTTKRPVPQKTQEPPPFVVTINGDKSGKPLFDPPQASVYTGYKVVWKNADTKPHGVLSRNGAINSGPCSPQTGVTKTCIQPGGSYTWVAGAPGMYEYKDSSRPYVNAQIMVAPR